MLIRKARTHSPEKGFYFYAVTVMFIEGRDDDQERTNYWVDHMMSGPKQTRSYHIKECYEGEVLMSYFTLD